MAVNLNFQGGHPLMSKTDIPEGKGSTNSRPNGHRDFYHNSGFRPDGSIDPAYGRRIMGFNGLCESRASDFPLSSASRSHRRVLFGI